MSATGQPEPLLEAWGAFPKCILARVPLQTPLPPQPQQLVSLLPCHDVLQGMSLVPAVTELMLAELLYLQYDNPNRPIYMYINSTGVAVCAGSGSAAAVGAGAEAQRMAAWQRAVLLLLLNLNAYSCRAVTSHVPHCCGRCTLGA